MNKKYLEIIKSAGLTDGEAEVYLAALSLGATTVKEISKHTSLERTNIYRVIDSLMKKGLMSLEYQGLKKKYTAQDPSVLNGLIFSLKQNFDNLLPELQEIHGKGGAESNIKIFHGLKSLENIYTNLLKNLKKDDFYYVISNLDKWYKIDNEFMSDFHQKRVDRGLHIKVLAESGEKAKFYKKFEKNFNQEVKILDSNIILDSDTIVTPYMVVIVTLSFPETIFVIENRGVIDAHKQYFEIMWKGVK